MKVQFMAEFTRGSASFAEAPLDCFRGLDRAWF